MVGECFAEGATHTLVTILHEATHALAHVHGIKDTSRQGKYHNRRFLKLAAELDLEWPSGAKAHPVSGFSEVRLSEVAAIFYADTIAELDEAIGLHLDTFRRLGLAGGQPEPGAGGQDQGDGQADGEGGKTFNRSKLACDCYPERSIRVSPRQADRGPFLTAGRPRRGSTGGALSFPKGPAGDAWLRWRGGVGGGRARPAASPRPGPCAPAGSAAAPAACHG